MLLCNRTDDLIQIEKNDIDRTIVVKNNAPIKIE